MKLVVLILAATSNLVGAQNCMSRNGTDGMCIPAKSCQDLHATRIEGIEPIDLKKELPCNNNGSKTMEICCPQSCYSVEGLLGRCVDIENCPHLASMVKRPLAEEVITYLQKSRCPGYTRNSVCCSPPTMSNNKSDCQHQILAKPPNPNSGCCGVDLADHKTIPGDLASVEAYPWLALIQYRWLVGQSKLNCGGTLISSTYVLTAAHCVVGSVLASGTPEKVLLGEYNLNNEGRDCTTDGTNTATCADVPIAIPIRSVTEHPEYNPLNRNNDIALVRMKNNAPFTDFIRPICLPATDVTLNPPNRLRFIAAGWGFINNTRSSVKLHARLPFVGKQECQTAYSMRGLQAVISAKQLCAGGSKTMDTCTGDSGGPLMYFNKEVGRHELVGLYSFGVRPCRENVPAVFTKVYEYNEWINSNVVME